MKFPKTPKRIRTKRDADRALDRAESAKVRKRSGGFCEWCGHAAVHVHHQLGGHGTRGRGESTLAKNKWHLCASCHVAAHASADVLRRYRERIRKAVA